MPAYYSWRPEFVGQLEPDESGGLILRGGIRKSDSPLLVALLGGSVGLLGVILGLLIMASGDATGFLAIVFSVITGVGLLAGSVLLRRLATSDAVAIATALDSVAQ